MIGRSQAESQGGPKQNDRDFLNKLEQFDSNEKQGLPTNALSGLHRVSRDHFHVDTA